ncbi:hypothetical protein WN943_022544 [Citrus x changshan-huyou]
MCTIFQITCDDAFFNRCLDCFLGKAACTRNLQDNVAALAIELAKLIAAKNNLITRVLDAERQQLRRLDQVQVWLSRVEAVKTETDELIRRSSEEIDKLCPGAYCSKSCKSSYKFRKQVAKKLRDVRTLIGEGVFEVVAEQIVVGLQSQLKQVWRCLVEESVGIIGLYGMGSVGKATLLTHINNKFHESPTDFDFVIWTVVSKDLQLEKIQEIIAKKIDLLVGDAWKNRSCLRTPESRINKSLEENAHEIFKTLSKKIFALLLDDIWEMVDLKKIGVLLPSPKTSASKVIFTTLFIDVCGSMEARKNHHDILELAQTVTKECGGLPLALITIGRAMAYKKKPEEWRYAIEVLRKSSSSEFAGLVKEVYPLLKFSYDSLHNDVIRSCFLYCCLYPEDFAILKRDLIDCWIGEGFLDERDRFSAQNQGYYIVGTLVYACLLEEVGDDKVKLHDVLHDMALWISCEIEEEKENFLVCSGRGLKEAPDVKEWENVRRLSLMQNQIKILSEAPTCPHLRTLFVNHNEEFKMITDGFFQFMPSLKVLNMSRGRLIQKLPSGISNLV